MSNLPTLPLEAFTAAREDALAGRKEALSASRLSKYMACPEAYRLRYVERIEQEDQGFARQRGSAIHEALDAWRRGRHSAKEILGELPGKVRLAGGRDSDVAQMLALVSSYMSLYAGDLDRLEYLSSEAHVYVPVVNPETHEVHPDFVFLVVLDAFIWDENAKAYMALDTKTTSFDIGPGSAYYDKLPMDTQVGAYLMAMRLLGYPVQTLVYDMIRWSSQTKPKKLTKKDIKEVAAGADWFGGAVPDAFRAAAEKAQEEGGELRESQQLFTYRLLAAVKDAPDKFFQRVPIYRTDAQTLRFMGRLWSAAETLAFTKKTGNYFQCPSSCLTPFKCDYYGICSTDVTNLGSLPEGYKRRPSK